MMKKRWLWLFVTLILVGGYVSETINLSPELTGSAVRKLSIKEIQGLQRVSEFEIASPGSQAAQIIQPPRKDELSAPSAASASDGLTVSILKAVFERINQKLNIYEGIVEALKMHKHPGLPRFLRLFCRDLIYLKHALLKTHEIVIEPAIDQMITTGYAPPAHISYLQQTLLNLVEKIDDLIDRHCPDAGQTEIYEEVEDIYQKSPQQYIENIMTIFDVPRDVLLPLVFTEESLPRVTPQCSPPINLELLPPHYQRPPCYGAVPTLDLAVIVGFCRAILSFASEAVLSRFLATSESLSSAGGNVIPISSYNTAVRQAAGVAAISGGVLDNVDAQMASNPNFGDDYNPALHPELEWCPPNSPSSPNEIGSRPPLTTSPVGATITATTCYIPLDYHAIDLKIDEDNYVIDDNGHVNGGVVTTAYREIPVEIKVPKDIANALVQDIQGGGRSAISIIPPDLQPGDEVQWSSEGLVGSCGYHEATSGEDYCVFWGTLILISDSVAKARELCERGVTVRIKFRDYCGEVNANFVIHCDPNSPNTPPQDPPITFTDGTGNSPPGWWWRFSEEYELTPPTTGGGNCALNAQNQCSGNCPQGETCGSPSAGSCQCCPANCAVGVECQSDAECDDHDQGTTDKCGPKPNCTLQCGTQCTHISIPPT